MNIPIDTLVDTHCHIDFAVFDEDRDQILCRAMALGVKTIVVPAVSANSWQQTIEICAPRLAAEGALISTAEGSIKTAVQDSAKLLLALGLHPIFIDQHQPQHLTELDILIGQHSPIAVGEIGLDFFQRESDREKQLVYFTKQLIIAKRHALPVIIHNRKAHDECINLLRQHQLKGGIIHAFNGSIQQAEKYIELGFLLGFGGMLTYQRSRKLRQLAKTLPIDSLVLETDAPDMTVSQHAGQRNSPEYLPLILRELAEIKQMNTSELAQACTQNFKNVFFGQN
ncbi:MAG: TatD DNase family protein [Polaribacter sp.]|jgi:TatD DNase family protein